MNLFGWQIRIARSLPNKDLQALPVLKEFPVLPVLPGPAQAQQVLQVPLAQQVQQELPEGRQVPPELKAQRVRQDLKVPLDPRDPPGYKVRQARQVPLEL